MMKQLRWGILGTGAIAEAFAFGLEASETGKLVAVGSRTMESAQKFAKPRGVDACHGSYEDLLADKSVEIVYIANPHPFHAEWAIKAALAGKHVLCEKPLAMTTGQGSTMIEAARANHVYLSEAFMYRFHPQIAKLVELIRDEVIGEIRMIQAHFGFNVGDGFNPQNRLFNKELGGGSIMDVGCYAVSAVRLVAGAAIGKPFDNPASIVGSGHVGETGVDEWAAAILQFHSGITAQVSAASRVGLGDLLEVQGSRGKISLPNPFAYNRTRSDTGKIVVKTHDSEIIYEIPASSTSFTLEADGVARAITSSRQEPDPPAMTWADSMGNLAVLEEWRRQVGVAYKEDEQ
ncbi:Gfo/Idh/MocA family oxidoreductase [Puniceicoccales bacterium CK1056]|uniref:Gfo/Idh/MocA family oxidoreductase n=1 Tax=Oceanipulchritudo coccoides TaxID=2706888 RepID=A0A6B2LYJ6_9BACT|nr:Gfo/Idh/MocA family oxidoreductase [Oceanipulchritudo coccoides]NDV61232.1 Gfo/Idh/MocA family oxidoreductase [Oceanipulchritudo coccoides]